MSKFEKIVTLIALTGLFTLLIFGTGFAYRHYRIWPTGELLVLLDHVKQYARTGVWGRQDQFLSAEVLTDEPRAKVHDPEAFLAGYRAILGYDVDLGGFSVRLLDDTGAQIHLWPIDQTALAGSLDLGEEFIPHGMKIFEDGSVVVNFDRFASVIARLDPCGTPLWRKSGIHHHSIHGDDAGGIWTWYSPDHPSGQQQFIVRLDAETGETLLEIPLQDVIQASPENAMILGVPDNFTASPSNRIPANETRDIFHPNDVEPLSTEMAPHFEMFEEGDLLISLRNLNLVAVLDPDTLRFEWAMHGPWIGQHDPDFTADGTIEVYDNAIGRGRSEIISVDPKTGDTVRRFGPQAPAFHSVTQGKHQRLPSGASLITIPKEGRVIELSADGELIFEFNNIAGDGLNAVVLNAAWVPEDFFDAPPACTQN